MERESKRKPIDFEAVKAAVKVDVMLQALGIQHGQPNGDNQVRATCPFCKRKNTFSASLTEGLWRCFGCKKAGKPLALYMAAKNLDAYDAAAELEALFLRPNPAPPNGGGPGGRSDGEHKKRFFQEVDEWLTELLGLREDEEEEAWTKRVKDAIKARILDSYRNGVKDGKEGKK